MPGRHTRIGRHSGRRLTGSSRRSFTLIHMALKGRQFALQAIDTVQKFLYAGILSRYADRDQAGEHRARCQNRCAWVFHPSVMPQICP